MPFRLYSFVLEDSLESDVKGLLTETLLFSDLVFLFCTRRNAMKPIGNSYHDCVPTENNKYAFFYLDLIIATIKPNLCTAKIKKKLEIKVNRICSYNYL